MHILLLSEFIKESNNEWFAWLTTDLGQTEFHYFYEKMAINDFSSRENFIKFCFTFLQTTDPPTD